MTFHVKQRSCCRLCDSSRLDMYLRLERMPLTDNLLKKDQLGSEFLHDISIFVCSKCGISQTQHDVCGNDYYLDYQYSLSSSAFTKTFMHTFASYLWRTFGMSKGDTILEVGSGDGLQLSFFQPLGARLLGVEPSQALAKLAAQRNVPTLVQLFERSSINSMPPEFHRAKLILLSYTFDHLPDPRGFLEDAVSILDSSSGLLAIEVHDLEKILARREFCLFEHEHATYYSAATLQRLLRQHGLEVLAINPLPEVATRGNSLILVATPRSSKYAAKALPELPLNGLADYAGLSERAAPIHTSIQGLRAYIEGCSRDGRRVAGYGAAGRGILTLAAMQASPKTMKYVCDLNTALHGYYTPASHLPIVAPERLAQGDIDETLVFSYGYLDEICQANKAYLDRGGKFTSLLTLLS
ncbi:MAG: class I SAM-dependent methyltransferase [Oligoflexia bacterium]|nr:class I SAM-dependent methyltransferase [Oligoflexia bacterium]